MSSNGNGSGPDFWPATLEQLQLQMTRATFDTWLKDTCVVSLNNTTLVIGVKNDFAKDWLENRLKDTIKRTVAPCLGREVDLQFVVASEPHPAGEQLELEGVYEEEYTKIVKPETVFVGTQYFRQVWWPILGPVLSLLVLDLRQRCYWNKRSDTCLVTYADLGKAIGVSEATVKRAVKTQKAGLFILKRKQVRRYSHNLGKEVTEATEWKVKLDEPILTDQLLEKITSWEGQNDLPEKLGKVKMTFHESGQNDLS